MRLSYDDIIVEPVITQIKEAVEKIFNVKVKKVNTMLIKPKPRRNFRYRFRTGYKSSYKKAIVTLEKGHKIDLGV